MKLENFIHTCNSMAAEEVPFLFIIDFECKKPRIISLEEAEKEGFRFSLNGAEAKSVSADDSEDQFLFDIHPIDREIYNHAFQHVKRNILHGNSYLLNLTFPSKLSTNLSLNEIYQRSNAKYKLLKQDDFVVFSPECFIKIVDGMIYSYPMKGTIDASLPDAEEQLMKNEKELWEHNTIVDLIRNDLSMISKEVELTKFRYIDRVKTHKGELLQVSSEIRGRLAETWKAKLGEILIKLLPAGSISGAPKQKTLELIGEAEKMERGYFTGIFGIFDGKELDSGVMIRYIELHEDGLQFRSGGGITGHSHMENEYLEMIEKVYVPIT